MPSTGNVLCLFAEIAVLSDKRAPTAKQDEYQYIQPQTFIVPTIDRAAGKRIAAQPGKQEYEDIDASVYTHLRKSSDRKLPELSGGTRNNLESGVSYKCLYDLSDDIHTYTVHDVTEALRLLSMEQYTNTFRTNQVDGSLLASMDHGILHDEFGMTKFQAIKLLKFANEKWRPRTADYTL